MTRRQFDEWVEKMVKQYEKDGDVLIRTFGSKTHVAYNFKTQKTSIARCHPKDTYVYEIGQAIAYARCKGYEILKQSVYKKLSEMKNGDVFYGMTGKKFMYIGKNGKVNRHVIWRINPEKYLEFIDTNEEYRMVD